MEKKLSNCPEVVAQKSCDLPWKEKTSSCSDHHRSSSSSSSVAAHHHLVRDSWKDLQLSGIIPVLMIPIENPSAVIGHRIHHHSLVMILWKNIRLSSASAHHDREEHPCRALSN
jgi:hypothetical protein